MVGTSQDEAAALTWTPRTIKKGGQILPCQRGLSTDGMTAVEIVGNEQTTIAVTLVGILPPSQEAVTRRNAAYAAMLLSKVTPAWKGGQAGLAGRIRDLRRKPHAEIRAAGWRITLDFDTKALQLTFRITR